MMQFKIIIKKLIILLYIIIYFIFNKIKILKLMVQFICCKKISKLFIYCKINRFSNSQTIIIDLWLWFKYIR